MSSKIMKTLNGFLAVFFCLVSFSCKQAATVNDRFQTIPIDLEARIMLDIRDSLFLPEIVRLALTDRSQLSYIEQVEIANDKIFIYNNNVDGNSGVLAFDLSGNFLFNVGRLGSGPGEYISVSSFFIEGDNICLYDDSVGALLRYDMDGNFIRSDRINANVVSLYPASGKYIARQNYQGEYVETPSLVILDDKLNVLSGTSNRHLSSGVKMYDYCTAFGDDVLYWEFLNDTIFTVKESEILPRYYVDFGEKAIPAEHRVGKNTGEISEYVYSSGLTFAMGVRHVQEDASDIRFVFSYDGIYYATYNKSSGSASVFKLHDSVGQYRFQYFMKYHDGQIILVATDLNAEDDNPVLLFVKANLT